MPEQSPPVAALQIFLSAVSAEFETYRSQLQETLTARGRSVVIQEDFSASGTPTLDKLAAYVNECDVVVHLIGACPARWLRRLRCRPCWRCALTSVDVSRP